MRGAAGRARRVVPCQADVHAELAGAPMRWQSSATMSNLSRYGSNQSTSVEASETRRASRPRDVQCTPERPVSVTSQRCSRGARVSERAEPSNAFEESADAAGVLGHAIGRVARERERADARGQRGARAVAEDVASIAHRPEIDVHLARPSGHVLRQRIEGGKRIVLVVEVLEAPVVGVDEARLLARPRARSGSGEVCPGRSARGPPCARLRRCHGRGSTPPRRLCRRAPCAAERRRARPCCRAGASRRPSPRRAARPLLVWGRRGCPRLVHALLLLLPRVKGTWRIPSAYGLDITVRPRVQRGRDSIESATIRG